MGHLIEYLLFLYGLGQYDTVATYSYQSGASWHKFCSLQQVLSEARYDATAAQSTTSKNLSQRITVRSLVLLGEVLFFVRYYCTIWWRLLSASVFSRRFHQIFDERNSPCCAASKHPSILHGRQLSSIEAVSSTSIASIPSLSPLVVSLICNGRALQSIREERYKGSSYLLSRTL